MYQSVHKNNHLYNCLNVQTPWKGVDPAKIVSAKLTLYYKKQYQIGLNLTYNLALIMHQKCFFLYKF